jgi:hypothetical protein
MHLNVPLSGFRPLLYTELQSHQTALACGLRIRELCATRFISPSFYDIAATSARDFLRAPG